MERRLSAILAADVVGYSRLMEQNEADAFERLRAHRKELFEPKIAQHKPEYDQGCLFLLPSVRGCHRRDLEDSGKCAIQR